MPSTSPGAWQAVFCSLLSAHSERAGLSGDEPISDAGRLVSWINTPKVVGHNDSLDQGVLSTGLIVKTYCPAAGIDAG